MVKRRKGDPITRFTFDPQTRCWLWAGGQSKGYGLLWDGTRMVYAHRYFYDQLLGGIPPDQVLDHLCRVPLCVNPFHLEPVTSRENGQRTRQVRCVFEGLSLNVGTAW